LNDVTIFDEAFKLWISLLPFFLLSSKYFPQYPVLQHPQSVSFLSVRDQVSHPYKYSISENNERNPAIFYRFAF
jgi:hypothetical protein